MEDFNSQKTMQLKKDEYVQSFTIHGLSKIFTGTKFESIFWTCVVLFGICISNIVIYGKRGVKLCSFFPIPGRGLGPSYLFLKNMIIEIITIITLAIRIKGKRLNKLEHLKQAGFPI